MRFSKGTMASLIATTTTVAFGIASSTTSSYATTTTEQLAVSAEDNTLPPFHHCHQHHQLDEGDYADTGILSLLSCHLTQSRCLASPAADHHYKQDNKIAATASNLHAGDGKESVDVTSSRELQAPPAWCPDGYVTCSNGFDDLNPSTSCTDACIVGGVAKCCSGGASSFAGFTGKVCKDGASCMRKDACNGAMIPQVKNSCSGTNACNSIGSAGAGALGTAGNIGAIPTFKIDIKPLHHCTYIYLLEM